MNLSPVSQSPVILSGAKDPIPACATTTSARSFYHSVKLTDCVLLPAQRFDNRERPPQ